MKSVPFRIFILAAVLVLGGCAGAVQEPVPAQRDAGADAAAQAPAEPVSLPYPAPEAPPDQALTPDIIYSVLVAEVAAQRGDLAMAYSHYMYGASLSGDPRAAQQATRIAVHMKDLERAVAAVERWVALAPNDLAARASAVLLYLQAGEPDQALEHLRAGVNINEALGQDGFMQAVAVISRADDRRLGLQVMRRLVAEHPDDPQAHYALVLVAVAAEAYAEAETEIRRLLETYPDRPKIQVLLGNVLYARGDKEAAKQTLEAALEEEPDNHTLRAAYARLLMESNELAAAYEQFREINRLAPGNADTLYTLGVLALETERLQEARGYLRKVMALDGGKRLDEATYFMGRTYEAQDRYEEAISWYEKISAGAYQVQGQIRIAALRAQLGDVAKAREMLRQMRASLPHRAEELYLIEGEILQRLGLHEDVIALFTEALKRYPGNPEFLYSRALSAASLKRLDMLERDLRKILSRNPEHADALNALGYTLADQTDRYQEALGYIQQALALKPEAPAILDSMGWVQYRLGNYREALRYLRQAMELLPDSEIAAHLGEVLWASGEHDQARRVWREALDKNPDSKPLRRTMERFQP